MKKIAFVAAALALSSVTFAHEDPRPARDEAPVAKRAGKPVQVKAPQHGGGLDKNGCHHDRKNGGYHCHR